MYPNLLTDSTARDLEAGTDPVELIRLYNAGWYRDDGGDAVVEEAARQAGDVSGAPAPAAAPASAAVPAALRPCAPRKTQQSSRPPWQTVETERRDSCQRDLRLLRPPNNVSAPDNGQHKRGSPGQDGRLPKEWRVEFVDGAGGSSPTAATPVQQPPRDETRTEPRQPETPAQEADKDSRPEVQTRPPPPPDYLRGLSAVYGNDTMDTRGAGVDEILLSSPEGNFHVLNRAEAGQSQPPPVSPPLRPASPIIEGGVFGETDRPVPPSPTMLYEIERETTIARFVLEA
jgi:hypothetical protein